jgi:hypothetical protein
MSRQRRETTTTDGRDLAAALDVPPAWLRDGWSNAAPRSTPEWSPDPGG